MAICVLTLVWPADADGAVRLRTTCSAVTCLMMEPRSRACAVPVRKVTDKPAMNAGEVK